MKRIVIALMLCIVALSVAGCSAGRNVESDDRNALYEDDAKIAESADSHFSNLSVYSLNDNELSMTAQAFTGMKTVWRYTAEGDTEINLSYSLSVSKGGKAKLVLITPENEVIILTENPAGTGTDGLQQQTVSVKKGESGLKIVGHDDPSLTLIVGADVGELVDK